MARPVNPNPPVTTCLIRVKQKNGWTYVIEKKSQYDPQTQNSATVSRRLVGKIPPGSTDLNDMVPTGKRGRPRKKPAEETSARTAAVKAQKTARKPRETSSTLPASDQKESTEQPLFTSQTDEPVIHRRVATADATRTSPAFAKEITDKGADYCCCIESNNQDLYNNIVSLFDEISEDDPRMCTSVNSTENPSEKEKYSVMILPALLLDVSVLKNWAGLIIGCIIKVHHVKDDKKSKNHIESIKYYITTLEYTYHYIAEDMAYLIRYNWHGQNNPKNIPSQWENINNTNETLDDDEAYLKGIEKMKQLSSHVLDVFAKMESAKTNREVSKEEIQAKVSDVSTFLKYYMEALKRNLL